MNHFFSTIKTFFVNLSGAAQVGVTLLFSPLLRGWYNRWGASDAEVNGALPGDELAPRPQLSSTHAITIQAPAERVWPWLAQMGAGRGGMYSYDGLENLVGCQIHNVERIVPELQNIQSGDLVRLGPVGYPCFQVQAVEPGRALVLAGADPKTGAFTPLDKIQPDNFTLSTWQFVLNSAGADQTRLLVRTRQMFSPNMTTIWRITEPIGFVMERRMLKEIKRLAEKKG